MRSKDLSICSGNYTDLIEQSQFKRVSILKIDIEDAELELFSSGPEMVA
jgi:hypothetical protein